MAQDAETWNSEAFPGSGLTVVHCRNKMLAAEIVAAIGKAGE